jgi:acetoin utilization deacetylase AcuC-like enzyme
MKVVFHKAFYDVYTGDPAAAPGRMESIVEEISDEVEVIVPEPADAGLIRSVHSESHIESVRNQGLYDIAALAAGGAVRAAEVGMTSPCFGLLRPPGHHASAGHAWGFCFFNNMAIALEALRQAGKIRTAWILDFDLHYGDGNVNILEPRNYATILNIDAPDRKRYLSRIDAELETAQADVFAISAGFDNHKNDWGHVFETDDYRTIGERVRKRAEALGAGFFAILEGGYNHAILGKNVRSLLSGMKRP